MKQLKAAWTGFRQPDRDIWDVFKEYAEIGYQAQDGDLSRLEGDPVENWKRFKDLGLKVLCTGLGFGVNHKKVMADPVPVIDDVKRRAEFYDVKYVNISWTSAIKSFGSFYGDVCTYDEMMTDIEELNAVVKAVADVGFIPIYHNHYQEFTTVFKGVSVMDYYLTQVDPRLMLKADLGWVYVGGVDPVEFMEKAKDRIALLHIKDFNDMMKGRMLVNADKEHDFGFCTVGTGKLDLPAIFEKALEIGQEWAIVEQDRERILPFKDAIRGAYYNMKETGFVE